MKMMTLSSLLIAAALLAGCAPKAPKTIYYWGDYQQQVYSYYQPGSRSAEADRCAESGH
ncbi:Uncharacterised protein [Pantoea agglomerans]|uniref:Lipoprotein n=1 Tax=Enterobacter agglomerans TaxID=549 RepID=A0A379AJQ8_ENTAG|nr:Uncharacterised protein [Pantoea agglomerans]